MRITLKLTCKLTKKAHVRSRQLHIYRDGKKILILAGKSTPKIIRDDQLEQELTGALEVLSGERGSAASLLALLPAEFTTADLIKLRARKGQSVKGSAISMVLNRWRGNGKIEKLSDTRWKKL